MQALVDAVQPIPIQRLVVVVDESPRSARAVPVALGLAGRTGASVEILGLAHEHVGASYLAKRLADVVRQSGPPVESSSICVGDDGRESAGHRLAGDELAAVVVDGDGHWAFEHGQTGRLVDQLLDEHVPVLVVTAHARMPDADLPVAVCVDRTSSSDEAVQAAARWAQALHVPLVLVCVVQPPLEPPQVPARLATTEDAETAEVAALVRRVSAAWPDIEVHARIVEYRWAISDALALHFARHPAQLVVVATHQQTWWRRLVHPGVTARLVDELPMPVVVTSAQPCASLTSPSAVRSMGPGGPQPFETVVLPIDPEHGSRPAAVRTAFTLARAAGASVSIVARDGSSEDDLERRRCEVAAVAAGAGDGEGDVTTHWHVVESGEVVDAIVRAATRSAPSVVCMGTSSPGTLADTLFPTVTGSTLRCSPDTVVLVGPRCDATCERFSEIVACVDGSRSSDAVVQLAGRWAQAFDLPLRIAEVVEPAAAVPGAPGVSERFLDRLAERAGRSFDVVATSLVIDSADPAGALRAWADDHPDALLVMGSHGLGLSAHPLGRTVQSVVRHAPTPVAVLPRVLSHSSLGAG